MDRLRQNQAEGDADVVEIIKSAFKFTILVGEETDIIVVALSSISDQKS